MLKICFFSLQKEAIKVYLNVWKRVSYIFIIYQLHFILYFIHFHSVGCLSFLGFGSNIMILCNQVKVSHLVWCFFFLSSFQKNFHKLIPIEMMQKKNAKSKMKKNERYSEAYKWLKLFKYMYRLWTITNVKSQKKEEEEREKQLRSFCVAVRRK